jgi:arginase
VDVEVVGVGFNSAGIDAGVARAPAALRAAGLVRAVGGRDTGNVAFAGLRPQRGRRSGLLAEEALVSMTGEVRLAVEAAYRRGTFPLVVGGDCPVLLGALAASPGAGMLFVDGHEDAWPPPESTTGEAADCELGLALGFTSADLPEEFELPLISPEQVALLGPRDAAELAAAGVASLRNRVWFQTDEDLHGHVAERTDGALEHLGADRFWLHVDLDVLSTESLAAVDYPQRGGLDWDELAQITSRALADGRCAGMSVTIYNPDLDPNRDGARRIVDYLGDQFQ